MADFTTNMTGTAELDNSLVLEFDAQFILTQSQQFVMDQFASYKKEIGAKSIGLTKYGNISLATTPLSQKEDVAGKALSDQEILFTPQEYGDAVTTTKLVSLQSGGKADLAAAKVVGVAAGRTQDKLALMALDATANVNTVGKKNLGDITSADIITKSDLNRMYNKLKKKHVVAIEGDHYIAVMSDDLIHDLREGEGSGSWVDVAKYQNSEQIFKNEVGLFCGFRIIQDEHSLIEEDAGDDDLIDIYSAYFMGFNALGKVESDPVKMKLSGPFDKLGRFLNIGWYGCFEYGIVDEDAIQVFKCASSVGNNEAP